MVQFWDELVLNANPKNLTDDAASKLCEVSPLGLMLETQGGQEEPRAASKLPILFVA